MSTAVGDIAFLANSENRVAVLGCLRKGPHSRHVIMEKTDVSRVTLGRILDELENRHWIVQNGHVCDITPLGEWVADEFGTLCETIEAEQRLRHVYRWFPEPGFDFDIRCLADADITLISRADASAPITRLIQQFDIGGRFCAFSFAITSQFLEACWRHVMDGSVTWEWVFTEDVLEVLTDSQTMARQSREMLESGRAEYRLFDGSIPYVVIISNEMVNLRLADDDGAATALIQSDDADVRTWAESRFDAYWNDATPVGTEVFTP